MHGVPLGGWLMHLLLQWETGVGSLDGSSTCLPSTIYPLLMPHDLPRHRPTN
jgi:hypothetical protein